MNFTIKALLSGLLVLATAHAQSLITADNSPVDWGDIDWGDSNHCIISGGTIQIGSTITDDGKTIQGGAIGFADNIMKIAGAHTATFTNYRFQGNTPYASFLTFEGDSESEFPDFHLGHGTIIDPNWHLYAKSCNLYLDQGAEMQFSTYALGNGHYNYTALGGNGGNIYLSGHLRFDLDSFANPYFDSLPSWLLTDFYTYGGSKFFLQDDVIISDLNSGNQFVRTSSPDGDRYEYTDHRGLWYITFDSQNGSRIDLHLLRHIPETTTPAMALPGLIILVSRRKRRQARLYAGSY